MSNNQASSDTSCEQKTNDHCPPKIKRILLGVCGGIAAYKTAELIRLLRKRDQETQVVMTQSAEHFIGALTLQALSGHPVKKALFDLESEASMGHIELARWADLVLIAPASANMIAKLAHGLSDDLLSTLCLAAQVPVFLAPAMNQAMWSNPATQSNISTLKARQVHILGPDLGEQACGEVGPGRMLPPESIVSLLDSYASSLHSSASQSTHKVVSGARKAHWLITAGPTTEPIDPVRFISNRSSGKMGYAIAQAAADQNQKVTLISGTTQLPTPTGDVKVTHVLSAQEMLDAVLNTLEKEEVDIFIGCAAVADYKVADPATQKIKKHQESLTLKLIRNPDILTHVATHSKRPRCVVGFAAETSQVLEHAREKLLRKKADLIVANDVSLPGLGFDSDDNLIHLVANESLSTLGPASKKDLAHALYRFILAQLKDTDHTG